MDSGFQSKFCGTSTFDPSAYAPVDPVFEVNEPNASSSNHGRAENPQKRKTNFSQTIRSLPLPRTTAPKGAALEEEFRSYVDKVTEMEKQIMKLQKEKDEYTKKAKQIAMASSDDQERLITIKKEISEISNESESCSPTTVAPQSFAGMLHRVKTEIASPEREVKPMPKVARDEEYVPTAATGNVEEMRQKMADLVTANKEKRRQQQLNSTSSSSLLSRIKEEVITDHSESAITPVGIFTPSKKRPIDKGTEDTKPALPMKIKAQSSATVGKKAKPLVYDDDFIISSFTSGPTTAADVGALTIERRAMRAKNNTNLAVKFERKNERINDKKSASKIVDVTRHNKNGAANRVVTASRLLETRERNGRHSQGTVEAKKYEDRERRNKKIERREIQEKNLRNPAKKSSGRSNSTNVTAFTFLDDSDDNKISVETSKIDRKRKATSLDEDRNVKHAKPGSSKTNEGSYSTAPSRRIAHKSTEDFQRNIAQSKPAAKKPPSAQETLQRSMILATKKRAETVIEPKKKFMTQEQLFGESKGRIGSTAKGEQRVARPIMPSSLKSVKKEPMESPAMAKEREKLQQVPPLLGSNKIPLKTRLIYLKKLYEQCVTSKLNDASERAQKEEKASSDKALGVNGYQVNMMHKIKRIRDDCGDGDVICVAKNTVSHDQVLAGRHYGNVSIGINRKNAQHKSVDKMTDAELSEAMKQFVVQLDVLRENGYPFQDEHDSEQTTIVPTQYDKNKRVWLDDGDLRRVCARCNVEYDLPEDGRIVRKDSICRYHARGIASQGKKQTLSRTHPCCGMELNTVIGCKMASCHVFDSIYKKELRKFVQTPPPKGPNDSRSGKVYALDCEMVYTMEGPALARLTVVDIRGVNVLDMIIRPEADLIDSNTEYSGLHDSDVVSAVDDLNSCHKKLFELVNEQTILVGHSLESDLKAMRVRHSRVIDTALIFPKTATGHKKALRFLASNYLERFIQSDTDAEGHCSYEDAKACIDLVLYRIRNPVVR